MGTRSRQPIIPEILFLLASVSGMVLPPTVVYFATRVPETEVITEVLPEKLVESLISDLATTTVTLNSVKVFTITETLGTWDKTKTFLWKYSPYVVVPELLIIDKAYTLIADQPRPLEKDIPTNVKQCSILYESTVDVDYGIPMRDAGDSWIARDADGRLNVRLPAPRVLGIPRIDLKQSKRIDHKANFDVTGRQYSELDHRALEYSQKNAARWAEDLGLSELVRQQAKEAVSALLAQFSPGAPITVTFVEPAQGGESSLPGERGESP